MEGLRRTWRQLVYTFSTEDRYAGFNGSDRADDGSGNGIPMGADGFSGLNGSQIQLNEFVDGAEGGSNEGVSEALLAWRHIETWCNDNHPDLYCTLSSPCTKKDIGAAEADLSVSFPASVRASMRIHDGQEDVKLMQGCSGLIYGMKLMSLDEIVEMTQTWRSVAVNLQRQMARFEQQRRMESSAELAKPAVTPQAVKQKGYGKVYRQDYGEHDRHLRKDISQNYNKKFKLDNIPRQGSIPPLAVQPVYAHPGWIPMVTDHSGNHIAIDLAPGPKGKYAQVILFGRDFDTKFVVADNWGDFLLGFVNDLEKGNWVLIDNTDDYLNGEGDLAFIEKNSGGPVLEYLGVLKKRAWDKWQKTKNANVSVPSTSSNASNPGLNVSMTSTIPDSNVPDSAPYSNVDDNLSVESVTYNPLPEVIVEESKLRENHENKNKDAVILEEEVLSSNALPAQTPKEAKQEKPVQEQRQDQEQKPSQTQQQDQAQEQQEQQQKEPKKQKESEKDNQEQIDRKESVSNEKDKAPLEKAEESTAAAEKAFSPSEVKDNSDGNIVEEPALDASAVAIAEDNHTAETNDTKASSKESTDSKKQLTEKASKKPKKGSKDTNTTSDSSETAQNTKKDKEKSVSKVNEQDSNIKSETITALSDEFENVAL